MTCYCSAHRVEAYIFKTVIILTKQLIFSAIKNVSYCNMPNATGNIFFPFSSQILKLFFIGITCLNCGSAYLFGSLGVEGLSDDKGTVDTKCVRASAEAFQF